MDEQKCEAAIEAAWPEHAHMGVHTQGAVRTAVEQAIDGLDRGEYRVAQRLPDGRWQVAEWLKKAVLLSFRLRDNGLIKGAPHEAMWWDKVSSKFADWGAQDFTRAGLRVVPSAIVRKGAHIGRNVVLMPSFVNIGAYIDTGTMVDTWTTVGSCAQIGKNCHLSGGVGIGGVLEPLQSIPVIIEDNCFIGARSEVAEGMIVREGAVLAMGVFLSQSTKIYNRATGETSYGEIPPYSVVVPGALAASDGHHSLACAVIVKTVDAKTRAKTAINDLLRDEVR